MMVPDPMTEGMMVPEPVLESDDVIEADDGFFAALLDADGEGLDRIVHDDFAIIDVSSGRVAGRAEFLDAIAAREVSFDRIEPSERRVRRYGGSALVLGRTSMLIRMGDVSIMASSRYTHVFIEDGGRWRIVAAQGTPIVE